MFKKTIARSGTVLVSAVTFAFAGFAGQALAATGTISDTGPDSTNKIEFSNTAKCEITNHNNISTSNSTTQNAKSGDVDVSGNTNAGGAGWNAGWNDWSPSAWQSKGYTYDQWHAAFMSYMASSEGNMRSNWGSISSGGAMSGNASNNSNVHTNISISNGSTGSTSEGSACGARALNGGNGGSGSIDQTGPGSHNGIVLGSTITNKTKNNNNVSASNRTGQNAVSGSSTGNGNTNAGAGATGGAGNGSNNGSNIGVNNGGSTPAGPAQGGNGCGCNGGSDATISNTGPDSHNDISFKNTNTTTITNTNNVAVSTFNEQSATSGNVTASHNTTVGGGGSGDAGNNSGNNNGVGIQN